MSGKCHVYADFVCNQKHTTFIGHAMNCKVTKTGSDSKWTDIVLPSCCDVATVYLSSNMIGVDEESPSRPGHSTATAGIVW